jgi:hypothetical protein
MMKELSVNDVPEHSRDVATRVPVVEAGTVTEVGLWLIGVRCNQRRQQDDYQGEHSH